MPGVKESKPSGATPATSPDEGEVDGPSFQKLHQLKVVAGGKQVPDTGAERWPRRRDRTVDAELAASAWPAHPAVEGRQK